MRKSSRVTFLTRNETKFVKDENHDEEKDLAPFL